MDQDLQNSDASRAAELSGAADAPGARLRGSAHAVNGTVRLLRRMLIALIGGTVVLIGFIMIITPGPAFVVIPAGLAILAIEFEFARRWLRSMRNQANSIANGIQLSKPKHQK